MKIVMPCSSGGHLAQLHALEEFWGEHDRVWVTFDKPDAQSLLVGERTVWAHHPTTRNVRNAARNFLLARDVLKSERPDLVLSNGAGVAVPFFLMAKAMGIPTMFIEVYDRIDSATLTGRLCYRLSDRFLLQWPEQQEFYPKGEVVGRLL